MDARYYWKKLTNSKEEENQKSLKTLHYIRVYISHKSNSPVVKDVLTPTGPTGELVMSPTLECGTYPEIKRLKEVLQKGLG